MASEQELRTKLVTLRTLLVSRATGRGGDDAQYQELRAELLAQPRLRHRLPAFLRSCQTLDDFWSYIKVEVQGYDPRRQFLREQFQPAFDLLEASDASPGDDDMAAALAYIDPGHVHDAWEKAQERRTTDPDGAITAARALLEAVCKHILDESGVSYDEAVDLPKLYHLTAAELQLAPSQQTDDVLRRMLGACQTVVESVGALRNRLGDAHGKGAAATKPSSRHAELAVNLAGAMATFLIGMWVDSGKSLAQPRGRAEYRPSA